MELNMQDMIKHSKISKHDLRTRSDPNPRVELALAAESLVSIQYQIRFKLARVIKIMTCGDYVIKHWANYPHEAERYRRWQAIWQNRSGYIANQDDMGHYAQNASSMGERIFNEILGICKYSAVELNIKVYPAAWICIADVIHAMRSKSVV